MSTQHASRLHPTKVGTVTVAEGRAGERLLQRPQDVTLLLEACYEHETNLILLHAANLTEHFFDLSSGEAGEILQKLRNYRVRLAVVTDEDVRPSRMFAEVIAEEKRNGYFHLFPDRESALAWLAPA
jgi:hypothetical protein